MGVKLSRSQQREFERGRNIKGSDYPNEKHHLKKCKPLSSEVKRKAKATKTDKSATADSGPANISDTTDNSNASNSAILRDAISYAIWLVDREWSLNKAVRKASAEKAYKPMTHIEKGVRKHFPDDFFSARATDAFKKSSDFKPSTFRGRMKSEDRRQKDHMKSIMSEQGAKGSVSAAKDATSSSQDSASDASNPFI